MEGFGSGGCQAFTRANWNTNANNVLLHEYGMELSSDNAKCKMLMLMRMLIGSYLLVPCGGVLGSGTYSSTGSTCKVRW